MDDSIPQEALPEFRKKASNKRRSLFSSLFKKRTIINNTNTNKSPVVARRLMLTNFPFNPEIDPPVEDIPSDGDEQGPDVEVNKPVTFDIVWEACTTKDDDNFDILTLLSSDFVMNHRDNYIAIGPFMDARQKAENVLTKCELPPHLANHPISVAIEKMRLDGYTVFTGRWKIPFSPLMIAFELESVQQEILKRLEKEIKKNPSLKSEARVMEMMGSVGVFEFMVHRFFIHYNREINILSVQAGVNKHPFEIMRCIDLKKNI